jgi:hypothetical protein
MNALRQEDVAGMRKPTSTLRGNVRCALQLTGTSKYRSLKAFIAVSSLDAMPTPFRVSPSSKEVKHSIILELKEHGKRMIRCKKAMSNQEAHDSPIGPF